MKEEDIVSLIDEYMSLRRNHEKEVWSGLFFLRFWVTYMWKQRIPIKLISCDVRNSKIRRKAIRKKTESLSIEGKEKVITAINSHARMVKGRKIYVPLASSVITIFAAIFMTYIGLKALALMGGLFAMVLLIERATLSSIEEGYSELEALIKEEFI